MKRAAVVLAALAIGCVGPPDDAPACEPGVAVEAASAPDRRLLGAGSAYPADAMLSARTELLSSSQRARRAAAWEVVARVLAPVTLTEPTPLDGATVPRFRTWLDAADFTRVFQHAYEGLGVDGRAARARLSESALDEALDWNLHVLDSLPAWTDERWAARVAELDDTLDVAALGGLTRIAISPDAARHVAISYPEILRCMNEGSAPPFVDGPAEATQRLARERVVVDRCTSRTVGPFHVASGGRLTARIDGDVQGASLRVLAGVSIAAGEERCAAPAEIGCEVEGPGPFVIEVRADRHRVEAMLDVTYSAPDVAIAGCLDGPFPLAAATVAAEWRRVELGPLPTYDTSPEALAERLAAAEASWGEGDASAEPGPDAIYTQRLASGGTFRLAGLHIRTRELDHWMNITLWWSPTPDETFGADRPDSVRALGGPWSNYAMCVAIEDVERDPDPRGGFGDDAPSLAGALEAVHDGIASWCSNPYIDAAPGLARSNCVGCHQHAMSGLRPGETVIDDALHPASGRLFVRNNFPGDQFWGLDAGDDLAAVIVETVDYWDTLTP